MNLVIVLGQLSLLSDLLDRVSADAGQELQAIEERNAAGDYESFELYEAAEDTPFARLNSAARAVAYELVTLVESELHDGIPNYLLRALLPPLQPRFVRRNGFVVSSLPWL